MTADDILLRLALPDGNGALKAIADEMRAADASRDADCTCTTTPWEGHQYNCRIVVTNREWEAAVDRRRAL